MGIHIIKMPDIGEGIAEVELVAWHVQVGDTVKEDQGLADVMTDKAAVEIPSPVAGKVLALGGALGEMMAVGSELIRLEVEGAGNADNATATAGGHDDDAAANPRDHAASATDGKPTAPAPSVAPRAPPAAPRASTPPASGGAPVVHTTPLARQPGEAPLASPAVRRRAWDLGIELRHVPSSGPHGHIRHEDLDAWLQQARSQAHRQTAGQASAPRTGTQQLPVIGLRRRIAEKMQEAKRRIPHFTYVEELDVTELEALRGRLNALHGASRGKLTLIPFIARAMVLALRAFPQINARYDDEAGVVTRYEGVHLGIAAQTDAGLVVPVLRHAESLDLWGCAAEVARLAEAARGGQATREELSGSTITLTSLGALGGIVSTPVINHPEVAIVGVNRLVEKPVARSGQILVRQTMNLSSSFDHRVVDGMDAARFIQQVKGLLETPATLFID
ncbi:2-oxo acid dehydrogenase subunit E2 [Corticibacter populi]|uniref:Dihydrolipoamide acetyltransferase component of pyruvate dehydrogenase complex n=1 Tax=Corticibacter populi TaxID=1550736 RepID=A0A3M6QHT9_9BURK|nr:dihydrolipoamide acetyltransferase family protein [Corticibacter populi]RMX02618.1 2-oxo acid dehydrogenase subunit E2 [Corticibacter populi]RZS32968.1 2-oxoisovalerate dehydrogenase E2 component (dihydrolipoyl transacylase) [Corticibacter populi]